MKVIVHDQLLDAEKPGQVLPMTHLQQLPYKKQGWQFNWKKLFQSQSSSYFYQLSLEQSPEIPEGLLMLSLELGEMLIMNNIEVHSRNLGRNGRYDRVAGCLLAYACNQSFLLAKGHYHGFLSFRSKTSLIELYAHKYGAQLAIGQNMFFSPQAGKRLIDTYLDINV